MDYEGIKEQCSERLIRRLKMDEEDLDVLLCLYDVVEDAIEETQLYLNMDELPKGTIPKIVDLAELKWQSQNVEHPALKSATYSEGGMSQSVTMMSPQEIEAGKESILRSLAPYRRRARR